MAKNSMWGISMNDDKPIHVVIFVSRNKDNIDIEEFKERRHAFITTADKDDTYLLYRFEAFVKSGVAGETSRMYYSVNSRNPENINKDLVHYLIDNPDMNPSSIAGKLAGIAALSKNALTHKWMFDFDSKDRDKLSEFKSDIVDIDCSLKPEEYDTKNGYAVIVDHGFDTRELLSKWTDVELKRDDLLLVEWETNEYNTITIKR